MHFSKLDWINFLKFEIYHSLEKYDIKDHISAHESQNEISKRFFKILECFYRFLYESRYQLSSFSEEKDLTYNREKYNIYSNDNCNKHIMDMNNLIQYIFHLMLGHDNTPLNIEEIEAILIYHFYNHIQESLKDAARLEMKFKFNHLDQLIGALTGQLQKAVVKLIIKGGEDEETIATVSEQEDPKCRLRILMNKHHRYAGPDRASFWRQQISVGKGDMDFASINLAAQKFITAQAHSDIVAAFLIIMLTKYHIVIHQYAWNEFRYLEQHIDKAIDIKDKALKAQKLFTFTRLIAKYFPNIFIPQDKEISGAVAKAIEIISYMRRGFAFELLGNPEKAFNDYSSAEKQANKFTEERFTKINEDFFLLYKDLTVPYIYSLKGELYRRNFAFYNAHQYFCNSITSFEDLMNNPVGNNEIAKLLEASIKIGRIKIAKGKTFFELGEFRKALKWHIKALQHLLRMMGFIDSEDEFEDIITYFIKKRLDPRINKRILYNKLLALTHKIYNIIKNEMFDFKECAVLFSEACNCISLIIFLFHFPDYDSLDEIIILDNDGQTLSSLKDYKEKVSRNYLAGKWLLLALKLNPFNCLARFNELIFDLENPCEEARMKLYMEKEELNIIPINNLSDLITPGEPRDIAYRLIGKEVLDFLKEMDEKGSNNEMLIAKNLLQKLLISTDDFSTRNAELCRYLMRPERQMSEEEKEEIRLYCLRRWSSINPALPRPSAFMMKGGGYFITFKGKGIAIDPGIKFVENLYSEGFSIADVHYIIATHDHIDHIAEMDTIMGIHYKRCKVDKKQERPLTLILNPSVAARYDFLVSQDPKMFRKMELSPYAGPINVFDLNDFAIEAKPAYHHDICSQKYSNSIGLILIFYPGDKAREFKVGITGDTKLRQLQEGKLIGDTIGKFYKDTDILISHINGTPFRELKGYCGIEIRNQILKQQLAFMQEIPSMSLLVDQLIYALGYGIKKDTKKGEIQPLEIIFNPPGPLNQELEQLDGEHLFLHGILDCYKEFSDFGGNKQKLFLIAETNEEMGSYRHKVAMLLNKYIPHPKNKCFTGDIGLVIRIKPARQKEDRIEIRCSRCHLNNDFTDNDKFHSLDNIIEICLKWEEEGLVYLCPRHDPESANKKPSEYDFAERIERYQPLRHMEIRVS